MKRRLGINRVLISWLGAILLLAGCQSQAESVEPVNLQCEFRTNPSGLDVPWPQLGWQVESAERNQAQSAYEILVASSAEGLRKNHADCWDSGRVFSDATVNLVYGGTPLVSCAKYFWKVRIWDQHGRVSDWSEPARWSMGLLAPTDWHGQWIGLDQGEKTNDFGGAQWIWFPEGNPAESAPLAARFFRRVFALPANQPLQTAVIEITADDQFDLFVNGQKAGTGSGWGSPQTIAIGSLLLPGKNILAVEAHNIGNNPNPAGLLAELIIEFAGGNSWMLGTGANWKSATNVPAGWRELTFDDSAWPAAKRLGEYGAQPWGIIQSEDRPLPARYLRREFSVAKKVRRATAYLCGLGLSELYLNGRKASDEVLSPAISEYDKRAFYVTYDVTGLLRRGDNAVGVILGNGRYFAPRLTVPAVCRTFGYPKLLLQLNVEYTDGTTAQVVSDEHWRLSADGPIRANNEFDGEDYDARMEIPGWNQTKFDDSKWRDAQIVAPGAPVLSAQIGEPIRVLETIHPVAVRNFGPGVYIFDLGQNIAGWCRLKVSGPAGRVVRLRHAEGTNADGTLYTANLRSARAQDSYTLKGEGIETYEPRFTHHGFRYVEVTGFPGRPTLDTIEGRVVHDALPAAGDFATSNPLLNRIAANIRWTLADNYRSLPTDLPRDERQGWMGDRQEVSKGESYLFNVAPLYAQWLTDIQDAQRSDGSVPDACPAFWSLYQDGIVWASTSIIVPQMLYDQYGDLEILRKHYASMKQWVGYVAKYLKNDLMTANDYADWCFPPRSPAEMTVINSSDPKLTTDGNMISTAIYYHDLQLMARTARLLGQIADAEHFETVAERIKIAFNQRYYNGRLGYYDNGTQTSCILPLAFGLVPDEYRNRVFGRLVENITVESGNHLATGLIGGHYLMRVLSDNGRPDLACRLATQTTYPSWGYMISKGATTVWELWNGDTADAGMNSRNIVMLIGDLNIWLHEYLGGIRPGAPGFKQIVIAPVVVGDLTWVKEDYDSIRGRIRSEWRRSASRFDLRVSIPGNTSATVCLPAVDFASITEGGTVLTKVTDVKPVRMEAGCALLEVGSGDYHFVSRGQFPIIQ